MTCPCGCGHKPTKRGAIGCQGWDSKIKARLVRSIAEKGYAHPSHQAAIKMALDRKWYKNEAALKDAAARHRPSQLTQAELKAIAELGK